MIYVVDVETTGLDPAVDRVVELAVVTVDEDRFEHLRDIEYDAPHFQQLW